MRPVIGAAGPLATALLAIGFVATLVGGPIMALQAELDPAELELLGAPAGAPLSGLELVTKTNEVAGLMRCPVCQGLSVADSPMDPAQAMKRKIERLLAAGYSEEQVLSFFETSYGEFIRLSPKPEGFNLVVWLLPLAMLALGIALVARRVRAAPQDAPSGEELAAYRERVRRELGS